MAVTVPLGMRHRFSVGHSPQRGWWAAHWRKPSELDWILAWRRGDDEPGGGVREPRRPPLAPRSGAAELPEPD
jgi:hypothetical protein